ncbi:hypothetical protein BJV78DRAFT_484808 [Lactifluus subvellereus]|nr:hypothetical protein BJV78DRAFT_484808 [Lactifluus subvellereus]
MAREALQRRGQAYHMVPTPMQPTVTSSAASASAPDPRSQSQFQIPKQDVPEGDIAPHHPHPQNQEWSPVAPLVPSDGQQAPSQSRPALPSSHATRMHSTADGSTHETGATREFVGRQGGNSDVPNSIEAQPQNLGVATSNPAVMSINLGSSSSTPPSSQQGPAQSILLASEEKSTALYTMRGLAASIKRSLNAERLAASAEPSASHKQKRMRSTSAEIIDNPDPKVIKRSNSAEDHEQVTLLTTETQPVNRANELNASPLVMLSSFPQVSIQQQETVPPDGFAIPNPQHESTPNFVPFSTLAGAVSFDNITESAPASHNSPEPTGHSEDLASSQPTPDILLHGPMNIPLAPVSQSSFNPLSFPHRTPTPPLAATITLLHDDDEVDEKAEESNSSHPTSPSHIEEADTQVHLVPSANEDDHEMSVASGEDQVRNSLNVASLSEYTIDPEAWDKNLPVQEADVFIRRTGEARSPVGTTEELPAVLAGKSPTRVKSPGAAETTGSSPLSKVPSKSRRKQAFYIDVPQPSEWVLRAKRREAEKKAPISDKTGKS